MEEKRWCRSRWEVGRGISLKNTVIKVGAADEFFVPLGRLECQWVFELVAAGHVLAITLWVSFSQPRACSAQVLHVSQALRRGSSDLTGSMVSGCAFS